MMMRISKITKIPSNCPRCRRAYFTPERYVVLKIGDLIEGGIPRFYGGEWVRAEFVEGNKFIDLWCPKCDELNRDCVEAGMDKKNKNFVSKCKLARFSLADKDVEALKYENN
jgi:hypothetical protein